MIVGAPNVLSELAYYDLLTRSERVRWRFDAIDWSRFQRSKADETLIAAVRFLAAAEVTTFEASRSFLARFADDIDFSQWISLWFYEESRHPFVLLQWLERCGETVGQDFIGSNRAIEPMRESQIETLALNVISEVSAGTYYQGLARFSREPVLGSVLRGVAADELRHAHAFSVFAERALRTSAEPVADRVRLLRVLMYWLVAGDQRHPVTLVHNTMNLELGLGDIDVFQSAAARARRMILRRFSQLVRREMRAESDVLDAIRELRGARQTRT